jgi:hypothetical protein
MPHPEVEVEASADDILMQWSRVPRSATIVARLEVVVDRAKFPA